MLHTVNPDYLKTLLDFHGAESAPMGDLFAVQGFDSFNNIVEINAVFSSYPKFWPMDRTNQSQNPLNLAIYRPWVAPSAKLSLDQALRSRVRELLSTGEICNIFWSGGIDSTTMLTAFLLNTENLDQLRVLFSPWSTYEHPGYLEWLQSCYPRLEVIDSSGDVYLQQSWDGIYLTGEAGDELCASLDQTFFEKTRWDCLHRSWQDYMHQITQNLELVDWFAQYCKAANRPIDTLLEARWWFYAVCKADSILRESKVYLIIDDDAQCDIGKIKAFYDCDAFLSWSYFNIHELLPTDHYSSYKKPLKEYCFRHNGFEHWYNHKIKHNSSQVNLYYKKKNILQDQRWLAIDQTGKLITTANLPFITRAEYSALQESVKIFNDPD